MAKKGGLTPQDIEGLKNLHEILSAFHQEIKAKARVANSKDTLIVRRYFEKILGKTSKDLSTLDTRIRNGEMALFRKETKSLASDEDGSPDVAAPTA